MVEHPDLRAPPIPGNGDGHPSEQLLATLLRIFHGLGQQDGASAGAPDGFNLNKLFQRLREPG